MDGAETTERIRVEWKAEWTAASAGSDRVEGKCVEREGVDVQRGEWWKWRVDERCE